MKIQLEQMTLKKGTMLFRGVNFDPTENNFSEKDGNPGKNP